jgi:hypothetical protein
MLKHLQVKSTTLLTAATVLTVAMSNVWAVSSSTLSTTVSNSNRNFNSDFKGSFSLQANQLVEDVGEVTGNKMFGDIDLDYKAEDPGEMTKVFKAQARMNDNEQLMFSVQEAKLEYHFGTSKIVFGRTILDWGELDQNWGFGKVNNRRNFDGFEPGQEGLTGFLYQKHADNGFKISTFLSLVYVPEMNPGMQIDKEKGTVQCQNPWCKAPAPTAPIDDGVETPIFYNVNYPEITDVVFRYSAGVRMGYDKGMFAVEGFALRKPENQLSVSAEIKYEIANERVFADITPQFYYHDVYGADIKIRPFNNFMLYGSALSVNPNSFPDGDIPYIEYTGIKPEKRKEDYVGGGAQFDDGEITAGLNYVARVSEFDRQNDILAEYPRWNQAWHAHLNAHITRKFSIGFDLKFDMLTEDRLSMYRANYEWSPNLLISAGVNMIGSGEGDSYWKDFANNDSVYSAFKYTF